MDDTLSDEETFKVTKIIYDEVKRDFDANYVGQAEKLKQFKESYIDPLYPSKRSESVHDSRSSITSVENEDYNQLQANSERLQSEEDKKETKEAAEINRYSIKQLCLYLGVGNFFCWKSTPPDEVYEDLGLGMCLYLKFMKHLVYTLLILLILSILPMVFYYSIADSNGFNPQANYQKTLFAFSIGSLSLESLNCLHEQNNGTTIFNFSPACGVGNVRILGPVYSDTEFTSLRNCKNDINAFVGRTSKYISSESFTAVSTCSGETSSCSYELSVTSPNSDFEYISVTFECINGQSQFGSTGITRSTALIISVVLDILYIVGLVMFFWSELNAEKQESKYFKAKQILLDSFSLEIGPFPKNDFTTEFKGFLDQLEARLVETNGFEGKLQEHIAQVRLPDNSEYERHTQQRRQAYEDLYDLIGKKFIAKGRSPHRYLDVEDFKENLFKKPSHYLKYKKQLQKFLKQYQNGQKLQGLNRERDLKIVIVFARPKLKRWVLENSQFTKGRRCLSLGDKEYIIGQPPAPAQIVWDNVNKNTIVRSLISWSITVLILAGTYVLIAYILYQRSAVLDNFNFNIECESLYAGVSFDSFDETLFAQDENSYLHCYCLDRSVLLSINTDSRCSDWTVDYSLYLTIPLMFSLGVVIINAIINQVYRALSSFEAHDYLSTELYSFIIKRTLLLTFNLALIVIILSIDTNTESEEFFFLFEGDFQDFSADWYLEVGLIFTLAIVFNMLAPIVKVLIYFVKVLVRKVRLRLLGRKDNYARTKLAYIHLFRKDVFMIEERYAEVLAVMLITLTLNMVFPLMTLILTLSVLLIVSIDKVLIIKGHQKPINYQKNLHAKVTRAFLFIILLHFIATALLLTEPFLLAAGDPSNSASILDANQNRFSAIFETGYVLPYSILFFLIIVWTVVILISRCFYKTKPNSRVDLGLDGIPFEEHKFHRLLNRYELNRTLALKRFEIQKLKIIERNYMKPNQDELRSQLETSTNLLEDDQDLRPLSSIRMGVQEKYFRNCSKIHKPDSILQQIAEFNYAKLIRKKEKNQPDKERLVKLTGQTVYEWKEDWVFFDEYVRPDYRIPLLHSFIRGLQDSQPREGNFREHAANAKDSDESKKKIATHGESFG